VFQPTTNRLNSTNACDELEKTPRGYWEDIRKYNTNTILTARNKGLKMARRKLVQTAAQGKKKEKTGASGK